MNPALQFKISLAVIGDDPQIPELIKAVLNQEPVEIATLTAAAAGLEFVQRRQPQIVLVDLLMPSLNGMEALERIIEAAPGTDVLVIAGNYSTDSAVQAIQKGASDYLAKPLSADVLGQRVNGFIGQARTRELMFELESELLKAHQFEGMVGMSPVMQETFSRIRRIAPHYRTALIQGAVGTGKELAAQALHRLSPAASGHFAAVNCSAVVGTLFESELFGHVKGAFTGATQDKIGLFEYAEGGTVFLDEIGDMPLETQAKLLRVLEKGEVQRAGSPATVKVDTRVIAASSRDLRGMVSAKLFREDLYHRFSMVEICLPRLCGRTEDLPLLERHFIDLYSQQYQKTIRGLTPRAQSVLARYSWPGNVKELKSVLASVCMAAGGPWIDSRDLPEYLLSGSTPRALEDESMLPLAEVERRHVVKVLEQVGGNKARAARVLGINRATVYRILAEEASRAEAGGK